jgi:hypothetical protein
MVRFTAILMAMVGLVAIALPCQAPACSLCDASYRTQATLRQELDDAKVVLFGTIANPKFTKGPGFQAGSGITEFNVARVLKNEPARSGLDKPLEIARYLPVLDPKDPPKYIVFCNVQGGALNVYHGRAVKSDAVLEYLQGIMQAKTRDLAGRMQFYFDHLASDDPVISQDAFLEFARCGDKEIGGVAKSLPAAKLRAMLLDPKTPPERLGLLAFLLGASGGDRDAAPLLRKLFEQNGDRTATCLDGILSGYIQLEPRAGWDLAASILADPKKPYTVRLAVANSVRFYQAWKPGECKKDILRCFLSMIADGEVADIAVEDLRQWKWWDLTKEILAQYGKSSHAGVMVKRGIVRYAVCCPDAAARQFVAAVRQRDPEMVREVEESVDFEKGK